MILGLNLNIVWDAYLFSELPQPHLPPPQQLAYQFLQTSVEGTMTNVDIHYASGQFYNFCQLEVYSHRK